MDIDFIYPAGFERQLIPLFAGEEIHVACTSSPPPGDMVKVLVDSSGTVTDMRKDIDLAENVYGYIGMFYCPAARVPGLIKFVGRILASGNGLQAKVWSMLAQFAKSESGAVRMADVGKFPCIEIDTLEDKEAAERYLADHTEIIKNYFE